MGIVFPTYRPNDSMSLEVIKIAISHDIYVLSMMVDTIDHKCVPSTCETQVYNNERLFQWAADVPEIFLQFLKCMMV